MKISIDIDDCLAKYMPMFLKQVDKYFGIKVDLNSLNGFSAKTEEYGYITPIQAQHILSLDHKDQTLLALPVHNNANRAVHSLCQNHTVILLTSRNNYDSKILKQHTITWLKQNNFIYHQLVFSPNKAETIKKLGIDILVDDSLEFAQQAINANAKVILFTQPWNRKYKQFLGKKSQNILKRSNNWLEISNYLNSFAKEVN